MIDPSHASVLFVCLGNICRSPLAEGVFRDRVRERGLGGAYRADSAGTGAWHVGEPPDSRSVDVARRHGVRLEGAARKIRPEDLDDFDYVIAMDRSNLSDVESLQRRHGGHATVRLLRAFDPEPGDGEVPDPYYGGPQGFDRVYEMIYRSVDGLIDHLLASDEGPSGGGAAGAGSDDER